MHDAVVSSIIDLFDKNFDARNNQMKIYWDYYRGKQAMYMPRFEAETDSDYLARTRKAPIENMCAATIDIPASRVYGTSDGEDPVSRRALNENANIFLHENIYKNNIMTKTMMNNMIQTGLTGVSTIHLLPVNKETGEIFNKGDNKKLFTIKYCILESDNTIPVRDPNNPDKLLYIVRKYYCSNSTGIPMIDNKINSSGGSIKTTEVIELISDSHWIKWSRNFGSKEDFIVLIDNIPDKTASPMEQINKYKSVSIPFVVFSNYGDPFDIEGCSDLENILPIQDDLNESRSDDRNVYRFASFPALMFMNGAKKPENFVMKQGMALEFDGDGKAEWLTWESKLEASERRKSTNRKEIAHISRVSQLSRGVTEDLGQVRSQPAIRILFAPDISLMKQKIPYIIEGEKKLIEATLKMSEFYLGVSFGDYDSKITIPKDIIGYDELMQAQTDATNINTGIESIEEILMDAHPEMSMKEIKTLADNYTKSKKSKEVNKKYGQSTNPFKQSDTQTKLD